MTMRAYHVPVQEREFELSHDFSIAALDDERMKKRTVSKAQCADLS